VDNSPSSSFAIKRMWRMQFHMCVRHQSLSVHRLTPRQVARKFEKLDDEALTSGNYYLNLHIVTGRKPVAPRPGDMLPNGTRQGFEDPHTDASRPLVMRATHWERHAKYTSLQYMALILPLLTSCPGLISAEALPPTSSGDSNV
jgi:hypothetical protein